MIRVSVERKHLKYAKGSEPDNPEITWEPTFFVEGDDKVVAGALRSLAEELYPAKVRNEAHYG